MTHRTAHTSSCSRASGPPCALKSPTSGLEPDGRRSAFRERTRQATCGPVGCWLCSAWHTLPRHRPSACASCCAKYARPRCARMDQLHAHAPHAPHALHAHMPLRPTRLSGSAQQRPAAVPDAVLSCVDHGCGDLRRSLRQARHLRGHAWSHLQGAAGPRAPQTSRRLPPTNRSRAAARRRPWKNWSSRR